MSATPHILVIDDDERLRRLLGDYLSQQGWTITQAQLARSARELLELFIFDAIVCDVMMPEEDGMTFTSRLREAGIRTPLLMLTAMHEGEDRIRGLEAGADDYLPKPFEPRELVLRLGKLMERTRPLEQIRETAASPVLSFGAYRYDLGKGQLYQGDTPVYLTGSEQQLLATLVARVGNPVSREELAAALGVDEGNERNVDVQVTRLRKKIEPEPGRPRYIQTVRGEGYVLRGT